MKLWEHNQQLECRAELIRHLSSFPPISSGGPQKFASTTLIRSRTDLGLALSRFLLPPHNLIRSTKRTKNASVDRTWRAKRVLWTAQFLLGGVPKQMAAEPIVDASTVRRAI